MSLSERAVLAIAENIRAATFVDRVYDGTSADVASTALSVTVDGLTLAEHLDAAEVAMRQNAALLAVAATADRLDQVFMGSDALNPDKVDAALQANHDALVAWKSACD